MSSILKVMAFQGDTIKIMNPLKNSSLLLQGEDLKVDYITPIPLGPLPERDTLTQSESEEGSQVQQPTAAQMRYWRWLREQKLLVGGNRYIESRNEIAVDNGIIEINQGIILPSREINNLETDWITIIFLIILVIFASVRNFYSKYLGHLFQSLINYSTTYRMFREMNYPATHGAYRLDIFYYITFSIFLLQAVLYFFSSYSRETAILYLKILGITLVYYTMKKMAYKITGIVTETVYETGEYLFNMDNINRVAGLLLFPVVLSGTFSTFINQKITVYTGILILSVLYLKLLYRGIKILFRKQFSIFYLFLYFCTLEFVPLVLLYKITRP
jgi:hypothetical protein